MTNVTIKITEACDSCGICVKACPQAVLELRPRAEAAAPQRCISCGHCVALCPKDAILHSAYDAAAFPKINADRLPSADALAALFLARRSNRLFDDRAVSPALIEELVNRALPAYPSAHNAQPLGIIAITDAGRLAQLRTATLEYYRVILRRLRNPILRGIYGVVAGAESLTGAYAMADGMERLVKDLDNGRDTLFNGAPVVLILHAPKAGVMPLEAAAAAAAQLTLMAEAMGLSTCYVGYFTAASRDFNVRETVRLPRGEGVYITLALGYASHRYRYGIRRIPPPISWR